MRGENKMIGDYDVQVDEIADGFTSEELAEWNQDFDVDDFRKEQLSSDWEEFWQEIRNKSEETV
jgi:hypothetical protein